MTERRSDGTFVKGTRPWNKGVPMRPETKAKVMRTNFQKGNVPHHTRPLGAERVDKDGYIKINVECKPKPNGFARKFVLKHRYNWEKENGSLPKGFCLKCLDGDRQNCDASNWIAVCRGVNARLAVMKFDSAHPDIKPTLLARARLAQRIGEIEPTAAQRWIARKKARSA